MRSERTEPKDSHGFVFYMQNIHQDQVTIFVEIQTTFFIKQNKDKIKNNNKSRMLYFFIFLSHKSK